MTRRDAAHLLVRGLTSANDWNRRKMDFFEVDTALYSAPGLFLFRMLKEKRQNWLESGHPECMFVMAVAAPLMGTTCCTNTV